MINAAAYLRACRLPVHNHSNFLYQRKEFFANSAATSDTPDLTSIPEEYHECADVFSQGKAETLPAHRPYDLKINLEEGAEPPPGRMYSLSPSELGPSEHLLKTMLGLVSSDPQLLPWSAYPLRKEKGRQFTTLCRLSWT